MATGLHLDLGHFLIGADAVDIAEAIAHHHRGLRHGERLALAQGHLALGKHAGAGAAMRRGQIHIHQGIAGLRIHRGCHHAHLALQHLATGGFDLHRRTHLNAPKISRRDFGTPLHAALANQAKQLHTCAHHTAHGGLTRRNHAGIGCAHLGLRQTNLLQLHQGAGRLHACGRGRFSGQGLAQLRGAEKTLLLQIARALCLGFGFCGVGRGLGQTRFGLCQFGGQSVRLQQGQHIAALHTVAHIDAHLGDLQTIGLGADHGLLPSRQRAIGTDFLCHVGHLRCGHGDGQAGLGGGGFVGLLGQRHSPRTPT